MKVTIVTLLQVIVVLIFGAFLVRGCFMRILAKSEQMLPTYLPTPDEVQQMINDRLARFECRIRVDGDPQTETRDAWYFVLQDSYTPEDINEIQTRWSIPEIDLTKGND